MPFESESLCLACWRLSTNQKGYSFVKMSPIALATSNRCMVVWLMHLLPRFAVASLCGSCIFIVRDDSFATFFLPPLPPHLPLPYHLPPTTCHLSSVICHLPSTVGANICGPFHFIMIMQGNRKHRIQPPPRVRTPKESVYDSRPKQQQRWQLKHSPSGRPRGGPCRFACMPPWPA